MPDHNSSNQFHRAREASQNSDRTALQKYSSTDYAGDNSFAMYKAGEEDGATSASSAASETVSNAPLYQRVFKPRSIV